MSAPRKSSHWSASSRSGYRPDLVIFYDGVNDTTSALLEGEAGVTTNERNRRAEFNILQSPARLGASLIARLVRDSASYRFAQVIGRRLARCSRLDARSARRRIGGRELAAEVVRRYRANLSIVDQLGRGVRFQGPLTTGSRSSSTRPTLTPYEREEAEKFAWARGFFGEVYDAIRALVRAPTERRFHDLSRLFARLGEPDLHRLLPHHRIRQRTVAEVIAATSLERCSRPIAAPGGDPGTGM